VRDEAALRAWAQVVEPAEPRARAVEVLASLGLGPDAPLQHRLARRDGAIVGAASFFTHGDTLLGHQLAVVATERRGGIGRALVQACAREALTAGARRRGRADAGERRLLPAAGLRAARVAARPLVLSAGGAIASRPCASS
jgi:GNAT superfamily N-acetyltransferase